MATKEYVEQVRELSGKHTGYFLTGFFAGLDAAQCQAPGSQRERTISAVVGAAYDQPVDDSRIVADLVMELIHEQGEGREGLAALYTSMQEGAEAAIYEKRSVNR